jgi:hypothetical protein
MSHGDAPEAIDTRLVFRVYGLLTLIQTVSVFVIASMWIGELRQPSAAAATLGMTGVVSLMMAAFAAAFSRMEDPAGRLTGLKTLAAGHLLAGAFLWLLQEQVRRSAYRVEGGDLDALVVWSAYYPAAMGLFVGGAVLSYLAYTAGPRARFFMTVRSLATAADGQPQTMALAEKPGPASIRRLRSAYEEQIRQAARR